MKRYLHAVVVILAAFLFNPAAATPLAVDGGWYTFCLDGPGSPARETNCFLNQGVGFAGNSMTFSSANALELNVTDAFIAGESFTVVINGQSFTTPAVPIFGAIDVFNPDQAFHDPRYSSGSWFLPGGTYTVDIFALTTVNSGPGGGGAAYVQVISAVPEPATLALLGLGLAGLAAARRRKQ